MPKRTYTPQFKADVLATYQSTGNLSGSAKKHGVPPMTLKRWVDKPQNAAPAEVREESRRSLLSALDAARWKYLDRLMDDAVVNKESGYYASQSFKILNEQHQLLSGGATQRFSLAEFLRGAVTKPESVDGEFKEVPAKQEALPNG